MNIDEALRQLEEARAQCGGNAPVVIEAAGRSGLFLVRSID